MSSYQHVEQFKQAMSAHGITPPDTINANGTINRFGTKKNSWYVFHEGDLSGGSFGDWKLGVTETWCSKQAHELSPSERDAWRKQQADIQANVKAELLAKQAEAAIKAARLWRDARPDVDLKHGYLVAKGNIYPHGVKQLGQALIIPVYDQDKALVGCQFIYGDGAKVFITGTKKKGSFCCLKPVDYQAIDTQTIFIVEGWATGVSVLMATDCLVFVAFDCGNLDTVAVFVRSKYPQALIVMAGDNDESGNGQASAHKAAKAVNGIAVIPQQIGQDWNDLHQANGLQAVKDMIFEQIVDSKKAAPSDTEDAAPTTHTSEPIIEDGFSVGEGEESEDLAIERLAKLSAIDYERLRVDEAKKLNIRATVLDKLVAAKRKESQSQDDNGAGTSAIFEEVTAWPYAIKGDELLNDITHIVQRFTVLSVEQARACALWIAFTWFIDGAKVSPMINITSPEKRCGKSTLLLVIESMVSKPLLASNISGAALFRSIELWTPTLLIDETDAFLNEKEELRGMLNAGHYRKTAFVIRTVGDNHEPKKFMTWCAKVLCGIGKIAHTLTDRSIVIELRRKLVNETVENIHLAKESEFSVIRQKLKRWQDDSFEQYREARPPRIEGINDRAADNWQPLQSIAYLAGGEWPHLCRQTAIKLSGIEEEAPSINVELLMDIADVFHDRGVTKLFTADLLEALCQDEEKAWATWNRGRQISSHQVSKRLSEFSIKPHQLRIGSINRNGYELQQFNEAIIRYKPSPIVTPTQTSTPLQPNDTKAYKGNDKLYTHENVEDEKTLKPLQDKACRVVEDRKPTANGLNGCSGEMLI
jgi:putative DNA primase/helicase